MPKLLAGLITKSEKWTQDALGRDKDGVAIQNFDVLFTTNPRTGQHEEIDNGDKAKSFSLYGALVRCYDSDSRDFAREKVRKAITAVTGKSLSIAEFNNRPETDYKMISQVIRLANV